MLCHPKNGPCRTLLLRIFQAVFGLVFVKNDAVLRLIIAGGRFCIYGSCSTLHSSENRVLHLLGLLLAWYPNNSRLPGKCGAEISMTLLVGRAGEAMDKFNHVQAKNVGMLQIGGVLAHNNRHS